MRSGAIEPRRSSRLEALRLRDSGLEYLKTDPLLDPLRKEGQLPVIEQEV